jgi:hypothetical protein
MKQLRAPLTLLAQTIITVGMLQQLAVQQLLAKASIITMRKSERMLAHQATPVQLLQEQDRRIMVDHLVLLWEPPLVHIRPRLQTASTQQLIKVLHQLKTPVFIIQ